MKKLTMATPIVVPDKAFIASVIFTVPPQGSASVGVADSESIKHLQGEIVKRLEQPVLLSVYPHRVGRRSCVAVHLSDVHEKTLDILITVTGNTLWPAEQEYRSGIRWNICVPDATDMLWVLKEIDRVTCDTGCDL
ncbi:hypothetical protein ICQ89_001746 [Salmonella enterica]|uniref:Uncharacterized protein n=8 Tax=Enterobacteriaceae TaxID=543 RepID=A0A3U9SY11_SALET|nr:MULTISPECIES: hypothetical protein [Enterobacteriaceae]EAA1342934.1 hypothetical protein [Salmonella enterica subsp. enterica serovar Java]EAA6244780.1 hypothetical protein [Salmonella enterica subsp. enterica serovar Kentucky]EAA7609333.1 hypothetical protein [Salmonella enterica subsp. enterica serovar Newport]EAV4039480.1 hypothetical protein [Salmonella enterica subsp. enterica serovar Uganda]EBL3524684.1 hypothetical protein [Salmonella enterica subsp. enterica serovar Schwarzengrund]